jgi:2-polyprenyl-3-methyl-5-hydroxy-6-metoxy-1,4-benzoquinol methylase
METDDALRAYYERGMERERLSDGRGDLEFTRTTEIVLRRLPAAPAVVADIGGGPGRYALWLASLGYQVEHRDLIPPADRSVALEVARAIERVPELTGFGPHLVATGIG